jgi:hypothetical protein
MRAIYKYPEDARESIRTGQGQQTAIMAAADPMLRDIEVKSGMTEGANVLKSNLYAGTGMAGQEAYATALRNRLPSYVNNYRAYMEEQKKKNSGSGDGGGASPLPPMYGSLPPVGSYFPTPQLPDWAQNIPYLNAFRGGVPMGSDYSYYMLPPSQGLARRMASSRTRMAAE